MQSISGQVDLVQQEFLRHPTLSNEVPVAAYSEGGRPVLHNSRIQDIIDGLFYDMLNWWIYP